MSNDITRRRVLQASASAVAVRTAAAGTTLLAATAAQAAPEMVSVATYILKRLSQNNVQTIFGVPGATWEGFFADIERNTTIDGRPLSLVVTASDLEAGYAADGYARMRGLGAVAVTRGVGMLSLVNAIAGAYAERSPVVVINGGPKRIDIQWQRNRDVLYSHSTGNDFADLNVFKQVTAYAERAETKEQVAEIVDKAITTAMTAKRPVYIEIATDIFEERIAAPSGPLSFVTPLSGQENQLAGQIFTALRANGSKPAILLGCEVQRYGLQDQIIALLNKLAIPYATTFLAKSAVPEQTNGFVGVYDPGYASSYAKTLLTNANPLLVLGAVLSVGYRSLIDSLGSRVIRAKQGAVRIGTASPVAADLKTLIAAMQQQAWTIRPELIQNAKPPGLSFDQRRRQPVPPHPAGTDLAYDEVMKCVSDFVDASFVVITDTSLSLHPAADINVQGRSGYVANAIWQSIGYSVGAAVGVGIAQSERRPLVVCGDGGFQMNPQCLSTMARRSMKAIVIVLDNALYAIEQQLVGPGYFSNPTTQPNPFMVLNRWNYNELAKAMGFQTATTVSDPAALTAALNAARTANGPVFITAKMNPKNLPAGLS